VDDVGYFGGSSQVEVVYFGGSVGLTQDEVEVVQVVEDEYLEGSSGLPQVELEEDDEDVYFDGSVGLTQLEVEVLVYSDGSAGSDQDE
jgi:hypothetical protein